MEIASRVYKSAAIVKIGDTAHVKRWFAFFLFEEIGYVFGQSASFNGTDAIANLPMQLPLDIIVE
jgi:hypothetical protein